METSPHPGPVYLDYAATAPVEPRVAARMAEVLAMRLGNPSSNHASGRAALGLIESARAQVAALIGADPQDIVFTSGATESNNLAITGTACAVRARGGKPHVITLASEHKAVLEPVHALMAGGGAGTVLRPDAQGVLAPEALAAAIRADTSLVTLLHVNNEVGTAQDIAALAAVCAAHGVPLHIDAAQSAGKLPLDVRGLALVSLSAHKMAGPQGIGALYIAPEHRGRLVPQMLGSSHERGMRAGTLATHQIVGFGLAAEIAGAGRESEFRRLSALRERLWNGLADLPGVLRNGRPGAPGILNASFPGVEGESLFTGLPELALSTGSACNSRSAEPSFVLRALGRDSQTAQSSLRFSLGWGTTEADIDAAITAVRRVHSELWEMSPARPPPLQDWREAGSADCLVGEAGELRLGAWVRFLLRSDGRTVTAARVQVYGCPHTIAACNHVRRQLIGRALAALAPGKPEEWLGAVNAPVEKLGQMLIIEDALAALRPP